MSEISLRTALFQRVTQLQVWLLSRIVWYIALMYLISLVLFALLRLFTGMSVKRIGYFSLRHIVLTPQQGVEIRIGKLGIAPHRPTVARPGFVTFVVTNLEIIVDPNVTIEQDMAAQQRQEQEKQPEQRRKESSDEGDEDPFAQTDLRSGIPLLPRRSPVLFKAFRWLLSQMRVFDVQFHSVSVVFTDVMTMILTSINFRLDLRKMRNYNVSNFIGTLDNYKLNDGELPIAAKLGITDVFLADSLEDEAPWQAFEDLKFDISGVLNISEMRAKEIGIQIHCGRIQFDVSLIKEMLEKVKRIRSTKVGCSKDARTMYCSLKESQRAKRGDPVHSESEKSHRSQGTADNDLNEDPKSQSRNANTSASSSSASSSASTKPKVLSPQDKERIVRGAMILLSLVHKVQLNVGIVEVLQVPVDTAFFAMRMKDMNLDLSRMNPQSSGFKLFYDEGDTAHQCIFSVSSVTAGIDTGSQQEEIFYLPLVTSLTRGNLFSQTLRFVKEDKRKNDSRLRSNWACSSPNVSIEEHQIATLVRVALGLDSSHQQHEQNTHERENGESSEGSTGYDETTRLKSDAPVAVDELGIDPSIPLQNLLPNVEFDLTVNDPAFRMVCKPTDDCQDAMFVMSSSRAHISVSSTHNSETDSYTGVAQFETFGNYTYYHSATANRIDIVNCESTQLTVRAYTMPHFHLEVDGKQSNLQITALRHEIFSAIGQLHTTIHKPIREWSKTHKPMHRLSVQVRKEEERRRQSRENDSSQSIKGPTAHKGMTLRAIPPWVTKISFQGNNTTMSIASNQFRGQTNEILGLRLDAKRLAMEYESGLSTEQLSGIRQPQGFKSTTGSNKHKHRDEDGKRHKESREGENDSGHKNESRHARSQHQAQERKNDDYSDMQPEGERDNEHFEHETKFTDNPESHPHDKTIYTVGSATDGRRLQVEGSEIFLYKADRVLLDQPDEASVRSQHSVLQMPHLDIRVRTHDDTLDTIELNIEPRLRIDLNISLILAYSVVREILFIALLRQIQKFNEPIDDEDRRQRDHDQRMRQKSENREIDCSNHSRNLIVTVPRALIKIDMPSDDQIMFELGATKVRKMANKNPNIHARMIKLYSQHPYKRTCWCILASLALVDAEYDLKAKGRDDDKVKLNLAGMRINVPYKFKIYRIIDNGITLMKAIKTLILQTKEMNWMIALDPKEIKDLPNIPRVRVKTQQLQISLEDDYFESDLTLIMLNQINVSDIRRQKLYNFDKRVKSMIRAGLLLLDEQGHASDSNNPQSKGHNRADQHNTKDHQTHSRNSSQTNLGAKTLQQAQTVFNDAQEFGDEKIGGRVSHAAHNVKQTATQVFDHLHDSRLNSNTHTPLNGASQATSRGGSDNEGSRESAHMSIQNYINAIAHSLRNVPRTKIELLLDSGIELGCPAADADFAKSEDQAWLQFWASPEFKEFRKLRVALQDGTPSKTTVSEARTLLLQDFSHLWIDTIRRERNLQHLGAKKRRNEVWEDKFCAQTCGEERIIDYSQKPFLMSVDFRQLDMTIDKTTHDTSEKLHQFLHDVGKGQPKDSKFSILIPLFIDLRAHGGLKIDVKDYPLPVLHFPGLARSQDPKKNLALQLKGDLIITEQLMASEQNMRKLFVPLRTLPREETHKRGNDVLEVHRTLTPIKTFTDLKFHVGTTIPTRVCWCMAYKAGFHSVGESFSGFSKPPIDPSPALGFWDKIRLVFHARLDFKLPKSPLCLCLKAGKSPYDLLNDSSGFVFSWRDNVHVQINPDDDPRKLFIFDSDCFELVVPNYMLWEKEFLHSTPGERALPRPSIAEKLPPWDKVVFSFAQKTVWKLGMMFQKNSEDDSKKDGVSLEHRDANFRKHYDVQLCMPEYIEDTKSYDAYRGFRADFIYMAISVVSRPTVGPDLGTGETNYMFNDDTSHSLGGKASTCACHLSLGVMRHFKQWKNQFNGEQWPPIKTGSLFPDPVRVRPSNKTFSTALSTAQYQVSLRPLDLSFFHQMRHQEAAESHDRCTGLKAKIEDVVFDWHTRREPPQQKNDKGKDTVELKGHRRWRMKSYVGEVRLKSVQVRAIDATLRTQSSKAALRALHDEDSDSELDDEDSETSSSTGGGSKYATSTHRTSNNHNHYGPKYLDEDHWIDMDDYTEVGKHRNLRSRTPSVKVHPFLYTPQFCYIRNTDFSGRAVYYDPESNRKLPKFGDINVHDCAISFEQPERVQAEILSTRQRALKEQISDFKASLESLESDRQMPEVTEKIRDLARYIAIGEANSNILHEEMMHYYSLADEADHKHKQLMKKIDQDLQHQMRKHEKQTEGSKAGGYATEDPEWSAPILDTLSTDNETDLSMFRNRYIVHAVHMKWNNSVRNLVYRLQTTLSEDKELEYVRCRRAVQYLEELVNKAEDINGAYHSVDAKIKQNSSKGTMDGDEGHDTEEEGHQHHKKHSPAACLPSKLHININNHETKDAKPSATKSNTGHSLSGGAASGPNTPGASRRESGALEEVSHMRLKTLFDDMRQVNETEKYEKSHSVCFMSPRIQLIAEENPSKCLQVIARDIELQVIDTYPESGFADDDSARIERRYGALLNKSGFFVLSEEDAAHTGIESLCLERYSGEEEESTKSWPPWLAIELCYNPITFKQFVVIEDISFGVRYDQPNDLHVVSEGEDEADELEYTSDGDVVEESNRVDGSGTSGAKDRDAGPKVQKIRSGGSSSISSASSSDDGHATSNSGGKVKIDETAAQRRGANKARAEQEKTQDSNSTEQLTGISNNLSKTLKHHGKSKGKALMASLVVDAPRLVVSVDTIQFFTFYTVLTDLLTYRDPLIKKREEAIDRVFLSNDFRGDYRASLMNIELLQKDIRSIVKLHERLEIVDMSKPDDESNREVKIHLIKLEREAIRRMTQLTVLMRAFKAVLRKNMNTGAEKVSKWSLLADSVLLRLLSDTGNPMVELYLRKVHYSRLSNSDGDSMNRATLSGIYGRNLLPNSTYPMMIANYESPESQMQQRDAVELKWTRLDRVGGIPVLDNTEVKLKPLHIQMEHGVFEKVLDFAFPINHFNNDEEKDKKNKDDGEEDDDDSSSYFQRGGLSDSNSDSDTEAIASDSLSDSDGDDTQSVFGRKLQNSEKKSKRLFRRLIGHGSSKRGDKKRGKSKKSDVQEMMNRASNYWSIRSLRIHSTQLTVSYKGKTRLSLLNLQNLKIPFPEIVINNRTVTKLDLIMRIRKRAIKALLSQSGSIIGNKFKRHKKHADEDDRDLGLDRITTKASRGSDITEELGSELHHLSQQKTSSDNSQSHVFMLSDSASNAAQRTGLSKDHLLVPVHRERIKKNPEKSREVILEAIEGKSNKKDSDFDGSSGGGTHAHTNSVGGGSPRQGTPIHFTKRDSTPQPQQAEPRRSFQSQRSSRFSGIGGHRRTISNPSRESNYRDLPQGSPRRERLPGSSSDQRSNLPQKSTEESKRSSPLSRSSTFMEKLKKGFN